MTVKLLHLTTYLVNFLKKQQANRIFLPSLLHYEVDQITNVQKLASSTAVLKCNSHVS